MNYLILQSAMARYTTAPSDSTVAAAPWLPRSIRETLGDGSDA